MAPPSSSSSYSSDRYSNKGLTQRRVVPAVPTNDENDSSNNDDDSIESSCSQDSDTTGSLRHSKSFSVIYIGIISSLCMIVLGWLRAFHIHSPVSIKLKCEPQGCVLKEHHIDGRISVLHLHRHQLVRTDLVRLVAVGKRKEEKLLVKYLNGPNAGNAAVSSSTTTAKLGDYVTSFTLVYHEEEDHHHDHREIPTDQPNVQPVTPHDRHLNEKETLATYIMNPFDLSLKQDKTAYNHLKHYIGGRRTHAVVEHVGQEKVSLLGISFMCLGSIGFLLAIHVLIR